MKNTEKCEIEGLPDKWKLIHRTAIDGLPDHPMSKWRDADVMGMLVEIAEQARRITELENGARLLDSALVSGCGLIHAGREQDYFNAVNTLRTAIANADTEVHSG